MTARRIVGALALLVMSLTPLVAFAQPGTPGPKDWLRSDNHRQSNPQTLASHGSLGRVLAAFALVGAGGYFVWRKTRNARQNPIPARTHVRVVGGTLVGPKARAVVADVGGRLILLGVTEQSVRKLAWLDSIDVIDSAEDREDGDPPSRTSSESQPQRFLHQRKPEPRHNGGGQRSRFSDVLKDAVGMKTRPMKDSAFILAESTQDRINLSGRGQPHTETPLIDIEGQAAGLVSRLSKAKQ